MTHLAVPVHSELIAEIILRSEGKADVAVMIENVLGDFLDRTRGDPDIWSNAHALAVIEEDEDDSLVAYGSATKGYRWSGVFLPNGTKLKSTYKGEDKLAEVRHQQIYYEERPCSPSEFASRVANNTSRNAWRDVWVKRPDDRAWVFANTLRAGYAT